MHQLKLRHSGNAILVHSLLFPKGELGFNMVRAFLEWNSPFNTTFLSSPLLFSCFVELSLGYQHDVSARAFLHNPFFPFSTPPSVIPLLLISFTAFAEALEAVNCGSEEETRHDGRH